MAFQTCPHCGNPIAGYDRGDSEETDEWYCGLCGWENIDGFDKKFPKKNTLVEARKMAKVINLIDRNKGKYFNELILDTEDMIENNKPSIRDYRTFSRALTKLIFEVII